MAANLHALDGYQFVTAVACTAHLAFALLAWARRAKSPLGRVLALLFFDAFAWNFAGLAYELSGAVAWRYIDRSFSSVMPALALHVVLAFVGKGRKLRRLTLATYVVFGGFALSSSWSRWWQLLLASSALGVLFAVVLLLRHRRGAASVEERTRTELILVAIGVGAILSSTELWFYAPGLSIPRLGSAGTLFAMALFGVATLRLKLLGQDMRPSVPWYALLAAVLWVVLDLAVVRWMDPWPGLTVMGVTAFALVGLAALRELRHASALRGARHEELAKVEPVLEKLSLNALIEEAVSLSRFAWPGVTLDVELEPDLPPLDLDRALVTTALENLVRNASESMPGGGLVTLRTKRMLRRIVLQVADEGRGMDSRELERATDAFFTTKVDGGGTGLHFAERVAKAHGGTLELLSTVGQGTVVTLGFTDPGDSE